MTAQMPDLPPDLPRVTLRILATTDLHGHILPWDDLTDQPAPDRGLAQLASLIATARAERPGSLLLDNGDFLNGNPLADDLAADLAQDLTSTAAPAPTAQPVPPNRRPSPSKAPHPMITAMNLLAYDAVTLGNHEFSQGLPALLRALRQARFPVVTSNLDRIPPPGGRRRAFLPRQLLLRRDLPDATGKCHPVTIGILGFLPPQTTVWERRHMAGKLTARCILQAARQAVPRLRRAGADLVIALSHSGLGSAEPDSNDENISQALAVMPGIDAVIAGHTHQLYPLDKIETRPGTAPLMMPGFFGSHLGVLDLELCAGPKSGDGKGRWQVTGHRIALRPVAQRAGPEGQLSPLVPPDADLSALVAKDVARLRAHAAQPVGHTPHALHSYFSLIGPCPVQNLLAESQARYIARSLSPSLPEADWPLLVAVAPFKAGGRGGPSNYTDIPPGPVSTRHIADLYIHPNCPVALRMTGADLADWLERSVSLYHQITPGSWDSPLINPDFAPYNFDMIHGLCYRIDLSQPARFDSFGHLVNPSARRIRALSYKGQPLRATDRFVLATNSYRASGGAGFAGTDPGAILVEDPRPLRQVLNDHIRAMGQLAPANPTQAERPTQWQADWGFLPLPGTSVIFDTGPGARHHLPTPHPTRLEPLGLQATGFLRFRLHL